MNAFLILILVLSAIEVLGALLMLASRRIPERTPFGVAASAAIWACIGVWALTLKVGA